MELYIVRLSIAQKGKEKMDDLIRRQDAITLPVMPKEHREYQTYNLDDAYEQGWCDLQKCIEELPSVQSDLGKYEYHYDHTDCIWYRPEARNRCPVTCAQYRDGWNDAMNYIFRDGKGYRPYRRGEKYE